MPLSRCCPVGTRVVKKKVPLCHQCHRAGLGKQSVAWMSAPARPVQPGAFVQGTHCTAVCQGPPRPTGRRLQILGPAPAALHPKPAVIVQAPPDHTQSSLNVSCLASSRSQVYEWSVSLGAPEVAFCSYSLPFLH